MAARSVLVTGGTGGLGGAVTAAFVADGWRVVVPVRGAGPDPVTGVVFVPEVDVTDATAVAGAVEIATDDPAAPLRAVVNLVGGYAAGGKVHETPLADFERLFALNVRPTY